MGWTLHEIGEFGRFAEEWAALNESTFRSVLLDPRFVAPLVDSFATGRELLAQFDGDGIRAMGLFVRTRSLAWQTFHPPQAPLGLWMCSPGIDIEPLLDRLATDLPGFTGLISLTVQDPLLQPHPTSTRRLGTLDYIPTSCIGLHGDYDSFVAKIPKNYRKNIRRRLNGVARRNITPRLETVTAPDLIGSAVNDFAELESAGWKGREKTAVEVGSNQADFYSEMMARFAENGESRVYRYFYGDRLVASDMCLVRDGTMVILKTTYDESEHANAPTQLMRWSVLADLFRSGTVTSIESYGRPHAWHRNMSGEIRNMYHLNFYRLSVLNSLHRYWRKMGSPKTGDSGATRC